MALARALLACLLNATFLLLFAQSTKIDGDFAFDTDVLNESWLNSLNVDWNSHKLELTAHIGRVFHLALSEEDQSVFENSGKLHPEITLHDGNQLPSWLVYDKVKKSYWGIPTENDKKNLTLIFKNGKLSKKIVINVLSSEDHQYLNNCSNREETLILTLLINKDFKDISSKHRVESVRDISLFLGIPYSAFTLRSESPSDMANESVEYAGPGDTKGESSTRSALDIFLQCGTNLSKETKVLINTLKQQAQDGTISEVLQMPLTAWRIVSVDALNTRNRRQAGDSGSGDYDGDYYEDDYDEELEYDGNEEDELPQTVTTKATPSTSKATTTVTTTTTTTQQPIVTSEITESSSTHAHRHHHGEPKDILPSWPIANNSFETVSNFLPPVTIPSKIPETTLFTTPTKTSDAVSEGTSSSTTSLPTIENKNIDVSTASSTTSFKLLTDPDDIYDDNNEDYEDEITDENESQTIISENEVTFTFTPKTPLVPVETTTVHEPTKINIKTTEVPLNESVIVKQNEDFEIETESNTRINDFDEITTTPQITTVSSTTSSTSVSLASTTLTPEDYFTVIETATTKITTQRDTYTESIATSVSPSTTKKDVEYESVKNYPPYIENRLKRKYVIAGKVFRYIIPEDTFKDLENGYNLKIEFLDWEENPIKLNSWCQYNPVTREVYGLPLEEDVSKWEYVVRATDKDGASVQDRLTILVQQHKLQRVFNHEFSLEIRVEKQESLKPTVDWSLKALHGLEKLYHGNMSEITVLRSNYKQQMLNFVWTNNSLPTHYCPKKEIEDLFKVLTTNDNGDPSRDLNIALTPDLKAKKVSYRGLGVCSEINTPIAPPVNYPPILRNPVDHINATVGELLVFKVPKDTFYDPEDVDALSLNISLLTSDRLHIPSHNWLQFDSKNREFYGIPTKHGRNEYQLICVDSGGLSVIDSLEVVIHDPPKVVYNVEFSMTVELAYDTFVKSAKLQRKFVEKLMEIFGDKDAKNIIFGPFKQRQQSTIITWFNKTLPTEKCAHDEINKLESIIKNNERGIADRVHLIMEPDFLISTIKMLPINNCKAKPKYHTPKLDEQPKFVPKPKDKMPETAKNRTVPKYDDRIEVDDASVSSSQDQYVLTYLIPIAIIFVMFFVAVTAACILYRRRRTGKMNVLEEGRHNFGNKGIPVIFQEELEEKPESGTKVPIILKDEKPPLAPPEYSKSGSLTLHDDSEPYHPPPPFTKPQDGKNWRPKPTPTYRKPPPYVPP